MIESFKIYRVVNDNDEYKLLPTDSVPGDSVCTVYIGGNGIINEKRATRLGAIVDKEILRDVADIPNYVIMYDALEVADNRSERLVEMDKNADNVLPRTDVSAVIYLNEKNIDVAYRRRVLPLLINNGPRGIWRIQFAVEGDNEEIVSRLMQKINTTMRWLNFDQGVIFATLNMVLTHSYQYTDFTPQYPAEIFEKILLPRISDGRGNRIDIDTALRQIRKINLLAQCHGGHVVRVMEQSMTAAMKKMGYTETEINRIMSQVLVAAYAPSCAMGNSKFQFIGFMSIYDYVVDVPNNWVFRFISDNRVAEADRFSTGVKDWEWKLPPMFLGGRDGNIFLVKQRFKYLDAPNSIGREEHNDLHYFPTTNATDDGKLLGTLAHNVIVNGIRNSLTQDNRYTPLPPIDELILDNPNDAKIKNMFMKMTASGNEFMRSVYNYARMHNIEIHPPYQVIPYSELKR
ncbi:MAG: hypothetical protein J5742_03205 [Alphaproteobacteria bacterium]|nr:hypothetical protein [Alphaproteobacteria bacterium]